MAENQLTATAVGDSDAAKIQATDSSVALAAEISVFGIKLNAILEKGKDGNSYIKALVCLGGEQPKQSVTLGKVCQEISSNVKVIVDDVLQFLKLDSSDNINIEIGQAYYYYSGNQNDWKKIGDDTIKYEYAFSVKITEKPQEGELSLPFSIDSVSFSIWNTERNSIIKAMDLETIDEKLKELSR